ncbi:MAG: hypothetical protein ABIJ85_04980, partial [bacterium]
MKKILILVDAIGEKKELFAHLISQRLSGDTQVVMARFTDLYFEVDRESIVVEVNKTPISDFSLVYFRRAGDKYSVSTATLALCLSKLKVKYIDSAWREIGPLGSKFTSLVKLSLAGLPIFPTIYTWQSNIDAYSERIANKLGYPLVAKELSMQRGKGVYLIRRAQDYKSLPSVDRRGVDNHFLFQKYITIEREYRLLVLGERVRVWEEKIISKKEEFRHNVALGAKELFLPVGKLPAEMEKIAVDGAKALNLQIAGVDIAVEEK